MLPMLEAVVQNPSKIESWSGEQTVWTRGSKFGHMKDWISPLIPIKITKTAKAPGPLIRFIEIGTKVYYNEQTKRAIQRALIGFDKGLIAIMKFPTPINKSITESTMPMTF